MSSSADSSASVGPVKLKFTLQSFAYDVNSSGAMLSDHFTATSHLLEIHNYRKFTGVIGEFRKCSDRTVSVGASCEMLPESLTLVNVEWFQCSGGRRGRVIGCKGMLAVGTEDECTSYIARCGLKGVHFMTLDVIQNGKESSDENSCAVRANFNFCDKCNILVELYMGVNSMPPLARDLVFDADAPESRTRATVVVDRENTCELRAKRAYSDKYSSARNEAAGIVKDPGSYFDLKYCLKYNRLYYTVCKRSL